MDPKELQSLLEKVAKNEASEEEKLIAMRELNSRIEEYSKALKATLDKFPE